MDWKKSKLILAIILVLAPVFIVLFNAEILTRSVMNGSSIPIGSFISWGGVFGYSLFFHLLFPSERKTVLLRVLKIILFWNLILSIFWGALSAILSGNWAFNFENQFVFNVWIVITVLILIIPVIVYLILGIRKVVLSN